MISTFLLALRAMPEHPCEFLSTLFRATQKVENDENDIDK